VEYLDARYESYPNASVPNIVNGEVDTASYTKSVDASGNRAERSPVLTSTAQLRWLLPIGTGNISTMAAYYHNSGFFFDAGDEIQQRGYNLVNLHVRYAPQRNDGAWLLGSTTHSMQRYSRALPRRPTWLAPFIPTRGFLA
jgi:hypothetical protein